MTEDPKPQPVYLELSPVVATSSASAHITTPALIQPAAASASSASAFISSVPLVQVASASVYPSASGASQVVITRRSEEMLPEVDARLTRNMWDMTATGFGLAVGGVIGHVPGAIVGGAVGYVGGRVRWHQVQRDKSQAR